MTDNFYFPTELCFDYNYLLVLPECSSVSVGDIKFEETYLFFEGYLGFQLNF